MHRYISKRKKDAQDGLRSNENDKSVTNSFADLKTLSTLTQGNKHVYWPCEGQICCSREGCLDKCYAGQLLLGVFYPRSTG